MSFLLKDYVCVEILGKTLTAPKQINLDKTKKTNKHLIKSEKQRKGKQFFRK